MTVRALVVLVLIVSPSVSLHAQGEEVFSGPLAPQRTYIKTAGSIVLGSSPVQALTPTTIDCPGRTTCTVRVQLSSQFNSIPVGNVAAVALSVNGSSDGIHPSAMIGFDSSSTTGASNVRTFSWMTRLTPGQHTLRVYAYLGVPGVAGNAGSYSRTLTIDVFKP